MEQWQENFLNLSWSDYTNASYQLGQKILTSKLKFDLIVAIARGGLTLSQLLSDQLSLPIASFTIESYKDLKQEKIPHITYGLSGNLKNKNILLVDDVCDTGKTFHRGIRYLQELGVKNITTASLYFKPHAKYQPDYFVSQTDKWIIYPYEVNETIDQLTKLWKKEKLSKAEIISRLSKLNFPKNSIKNIYKIWY